MIRNRRGQRSQGFSLVEILIAVVVLAVTFSVATPLVANLRQQRAVHAGADDFLFAHALARATAVKHGRLVELHLRPSTGRFWIAVDTSGAGRPDTVGFVHDLNELGVSLSSNQNLLCFDARGVGNGRGACGDALAVVVFTAGPYADTVVVTAAGNVVR